MRRYERRRGAKVTGDADPEDVESRKRHRWIWSMGSRTQQATPVDAVGRVSTDSPGSEVASSLTRRMRGNQGDPSGGAPEGAHPRTSLNSEEEGGVWRKSETPIVAMRSGNADGVKGCRLERTSRRNMARH